MLISFLQDYGFTERQAKAYLACLELGSATTSTIARLCGENRLTTYSILKEFVKKGFIKEFVKNKIKYYVANSPEKILKDQEYKYKKLQERMPELMAMLNNNVNKPKIEYFEGKDGIKAIYHDYLNSTNEDIYSFFNYGMFPQDLIDDLVSNYVPKRLEAGIFAKVIVGNSPKDLEYQAMDEELNLKKTIIIKEMPFNLQSQIDIYCQNKVSFIMSHEAELFGIIITSKMAHDTMKAIFDLVRKQNGGI